MSDEQIEQIEITIKQQQKFVNSMKSLRTLMDSTEWKTVMTEGYFNQESRRLVMLKSDPMQQTAEQQKTIDNAIMAVGGLALYLDSIMGMGQAAMNAVASHEQAREDILDEMANQDEN